jgi:presenilin-like A22 family membrane protease
METNQENQKSIPEIILEPWRIFIIEAFLFCLTLTLGIITAIKLNAALEIQRITLPKISPWQFILYFLFATLFIFLISSFIRAKKEKRIIYKAVFILVSWWAGGITLSLWIPNLFALILMGILVFWRSKSPSILNHNLCLILGLAGIGSTLGLSLAPSIVVLLLIIFSIYDFIAVYKTKHMIKMAKEMIETGTILALIIPPKIGDFKAELKKIKPGGRFLILGGGDLAFPLLFCASLVSQGILNSLIVAIFSLIGLFAGFYFFISQPPTSPGGGRQPIPALPPIALFSIIGYFATKLFEL